MSAKNHIARGVGRMCTETMVSGKGSWVTMASGKKCLDFTTGIGVVNTGHCHPRVVSAAQDQMGKLIHGQVNIAYHDKMLELTDTLLPIIPKGLDTLFYCSTGAESVENAIKMSRVFTKKQGVIVFSGGYHGRTMGTMAMTTSSRIYRQKFGPLMPGVLVTPFPDPFFNIDSDKAMRELEHLFQTQCHEDDIACIVMEPVLGEGGYVPAPDDFIKRVQDFAKSKNILFVSDEVQTGFGRTGSLFACDSKRHGHITPDILTMAKGIASGFPLAGVATRKEIAEACEPGMLGGTYAGNAVACAAAVETQKVIQEEKLVENSANKGLRLRNNLLHLKNIYSEYIKDIRGVGCMVGIEFTEKAPAGTKAKMSAACLDHGMLALGCSSREVMRFIPPLIISDEEVDIGTEIFEKAVKDVFSL